MLFEAGMLVTTFVVQLVGISAESVFTQVPLGSVNFYFPFLPT